MTNVEGMPRPHFEAMFLSASGGALAIVGQLVLLLALILCCKASAQNEHGSDYIRSSQPALLDYPELVVLGEQESVDPALANKLDTLLTTPFINNEAYYAGTKPLRPDLKGMGPSLRLVEWNIERGIEFDEIKSLLTDKQGFLAKVHSEAASNTSAAKVDDQVLNAQMDLLQSADVLVLNEVDWGMKRSDYRAVAKDLADALKMNWAYGVEFVEVDPKVLGTQSFENVTNDAERKELDDLFNTDKTRLLGLHGTAILSRYPLRDVKLVPFSIRLMTGTTARRSMEPSKPANVRAQACSSENTSCARYAAEAAPTLLRPSMCLIFRCAKSPSLRLTLRTARHRRGESSRQMNFWR